MQKNSIWTLLLKVFSFLAVTFLVLGAVIVNAGSLGLPENQVAGTAVLIFGVLAVIAALAASLWMNYKIQRELTAGAGLAQQIAQGELVDAEEDGPLSSALVDISNYMNEKAAIADQVAVGNLSADVPVRSEYDRFGNSFQNMTDQLRELVQTQEKRERLQNSILKVT